MQRTLILAAIAAVLIGGCASPARDTAGGSCAETLSALQQRYKNSFTEFFKVRDEGRPGAPKLKGVTTEREAFNALAAACGPECTAGVRLLPDRGRLGGRLWGLVSVPVATLHGAPSYSGALETQVVLGTPLRLLDKSGNWYLAQSPEGCIEWINGWQVKRLTEQELAAWNAKPRVIVTVPELPLTSEAAGSPAGLATGGSVLVLESELPGGKLRVRMPDGTAALLPREGTAPLIAWSRGQEALSRNDPTAFRKALGDSARALLGRSYLWAGASTLAMDCSGFTQTVWRMNGFIIPRNSREQAFVSPVLSESGRHPFQTGDLLFFGKKASGTEPARVSHVGLSLGGARFIHALGSVRTGSFDPADAEHDAYNSGRFLWGTAAPSAAAPGSCVTLYHTNPFYSTRPQPLAACRNYR